MVESMNGLSREYLIPPGETLKELLDDRGMQQKELAIRTGFTQKHISNIINGTASLSFAAALKLENALGVPASFWNALEAEYQAEMEKYAEVNNVDDNEIDLLNRVPKEIFKYKYVQQGLSKQDSVVQARKFYNVSNLNAVNALYAHTSFRKSTVCSCDVFALAAWIKICELETSEIITNSFSMEELKRHIPKMRALIADNDINYAVFELRQLLAKCGIAFSVVRGIKGAPVQGMIRKTGNKIILCLTIRYKYADIFWFSLFHEIGHLLSDNIPNIFIDYEKTVDNPEIEAKADAFASEVLIPKEDYDAFKRYLPVLSKQIIVAFANRIKIAPGAVVGRLLHDQLIPYNHFQDLRIKYEWGET